MKSERSLALLPLFLGLLLVAGILPASAQLGDLFKLNGEKTAEARPAPEIRDQLTLWQTETKQALARLEKLNPETDLPAGTTPANFSTRRRHLEEAQLAISRHFAALEAITTSAAELEEARAQAESWSGFSEEPPYSILMVDELVSRREALAERAVSQQSSIEIFQATLEKLLRESKATESSSAEALAAYEASEEDRALLWKLETLRAKQRSLFIRASALQSSIAALNNQMLTTGVELGLLSRQIEAAEQNAVFAEEDLAQVTQASVDRQAALRKELVEIRKLLRPAGGERTARASALEKLRAAADPDPAAVEAAELPLEAAVARVETLQQMIELFESYGQLESFVPEAYEERFVLLNGKSKEERKAALENLINLNQQLNAWEIYAKNELAAVSTNINRIESRASLLPAGDPKLAPLAEQREVLREKRDLIQRASLSVSSQRQLVTRWIEEHEVREKDPWYAPLSDSVTRSWEMLRRAWNHPVSKYEESIERDGQLVVTQRSVTLGTILLAILLFVVTYLIASHISNRAQRILVGRQVIGENQARTLRNWVMLLVAFLLALATLSYLSIPLTIFAFLAGALAIGVGFGTQTMIKNFISGIILLVERKVRVGDIIEVDTVLGVVSEINTRSSIIRCFNGVETLIPNSLFLENRVINWTLNNRFLRRELKLGVAYGSPTQKVIEILNDAADRHGLIQKDPAPFAIFSNFGDNALEFTLLFWIELNDKTNGMIVESDVRIMIDKKLTEAGIGVPFPQRDIHLGTQKPLQLELVRAAAGGMAVSAK